MTTFATNPRATFDYQILETIEAGLKLTGHEVKAVKAGKCSLRGSYVKTSGTDLILIGATISPYQPSNLPPDYEPDRSIQLLIKKSESKKLAQELETAGLTLVPLKLYSKNNLVKLEIGLARGKKKYDKRESIKKREFERKEKRGAQGAPLFFIPQFFAAPLPVPPRRLTSAPSPLPTYRLPLFVLQLGFARLRPDALP